jgi:archaemetzincin
LKNTGAKIRLVAHLIIEIVTVGKVECPPLDALSRELTRAYALPNGCCLIGPSLEMPPAAYNAQRRQHDAGLILDRVQHRIAGENKVLALTSADLYTRLHDYNFIFGLAQLRGSVALVSLHRLNPTFYGERSDQKMFFAHVVKEAVHEIGHTFGLGHCADPKCVMSFSNSILDVDAKSAAFCGNCKEKLHAR